MLQDDIKNYLENYVEHLVFIDDVRAWSDLTKEDIKTIYEKVIKKFSADHRFHAFIAVDDFLLCTLQGAYDPYEDLSERMLDLCHCPVSCLIRSNVKKLEDNVVITPGVTDEELENLAFNAESIQHINELYNPMESVCHINYTTRMS